MSRPPQFLVYPLVLLAGAALGSGVLSIQIPQQKAQAATMPGGKRLPPAHGRLSAESPELRELRLAESALFPEVGSADLELSNPELWDEVLEQATKREKDIKSGALDEAADDVFAGLKMPGFAIRRHPRVARYVEYFTSSAKGRKLMTTWLRRSGRYQTILESALQGRGLPRELTAVVFIESGFWPTARSHAGAVGLWQFMPKTGRAYGLVIDKGIDERRSIWRSTEAAAQHLADLHERFNSWELALAAYNMGYEQLNSRMQEMGAEDFWALSSVEGALPRETALYVPKVLAVMIVLNNLERFQLHEIEKLPELRASEIKVPPGVRLSLMARAAGTSLRVIRELNPEFRTDVVPDRGGPIAVHIPSDGLSRAKTMLPRLLQDDEKLDLEVSAEFDWGDQELEGGGKSRLEKTTPGAPGGGDSDADVETQSILKSPALPKQDVKRVKPLGALMTAPPKAVPTDPQFAGEVGEVLEASNKPLPASKMKLEVQPGDTIWKLSEIYGTPRWKIIKDNALTNPETLSVGRKLVLNVPEFKGADAPKEDEKKPAEKKRAK